MEPRFRILPLGDAAVTIELGDRIDPAVNDRVIAYAESVREQRWPWVLEVVPTFYSVTIHVDPLQLDIGSLPELLSSLSPAGTRARALRRTHRIPVLYGGEWGPDLQDVADFARLSLPAAIALHHSADYRCYMLGFSPGFPYLGPVPDRIAMPRLATPRTIVPAGSVGIGGNQTGIYPSATPGGWRLIGRTPVPLYDSDAFLMQPGDTVRFEPIDREEYSRLAKARHARTH